MLTMKTITDFLNELASNSPAPGGGSAAALSGAIGSALTSMVCNLTIGKKKYADVELIMKELLQKSERIHKQFAMLINEDAQAFDKVMEAYGLPKDSDEQKTLRDIAIQEATKGAAMVPLQVMKYAIDALAIVKIAAEKGNKNSITDAGVAAILLHAAAEGAALNVLVNLRSIGDAEFVNVKSGEVRTLQRMSKNMMEEIMELVKVELGVKT